MQFFSGFFSFLNFLFFKSDTHRFVGGGLKLGFTFWRGFLTMLQQTGDEDDDVYN